MKKVRINKAYSFKQAKEFDIKFWRRAGAAARFSAAWGMVTEFLKMKGKHGDKPRLRRTIQNIERL